MWKIGLKMSQSPERDQFWLHAQNQPFSLFTPPVPFLPFPSPLLLHTLCESLCVWRLKKPHLDAKSCYFLHQQCNSLPGSLSLSECLLFTQMPPPVGMCKHRHLSRRHAVSLLGVRCCSLFNNITGQAQQHRSHVCVEMKRISQFSTANMYYLLLAICFHLQGHGRSSPMNPSMSTQISTAGSNLEVQNVM